jgi:hypothetical protein
MAAGTYLNFMLRVWHGGLSLSLYLSLSLSTYTYVYIYILMHSYMNIYNYILYLVQYISSCGMVSKFYE